MDWMAKTAAAVVSLVALAAFVLRTMKSGWVPDEQGIGFLLVAAVLPFVSQLKKFKFGNVEFEKDVQQLRGRVDELAELRRSDELEAPALLTSDLPRVAPLEEAVHNIEKEVYPSGVSFETDTVEDYFPSQAPQGVKAFATVQRSRNFDDRFFVSVELKVDDTSDLSDRRAVFFLHHSFRRRVRYEALVDGAAHLSLTARGAFSLGIALASGELFRVDLRKASLSLTDEEREVFLGEV